MNENTITKIEVQKKNPIRVSLFINGDFAFGIHCKVAEKYDLKVGMKLEAAMIETLLKEEENKKALQKAYHLLSYSDRTEKVMADKLRDAGFEPDAVQYALEKLRAQNLIDDERYAREFIQNRLHKYGKRKLRYDLTNKGVPETMVDALLEEVMEDEEYLSALDIGRKKMVQSEHLEGSKVYSRVASLLQRKGYSYQIVRRVLESLELKPY